MKAIGILFCAVVLMALACFFEPRWIPSWFPLPVPAPPPAGSFRITAIPESFPTNPRSGYPGGRVAGFEIDYRGPRQSMELVVENWEGPTLVSTVVVMKQPFGSREMVKRGNTHFSESRPAFSHTRESFSVWLKKLPEAFPDGRNTVASVVYGNPAMTNTAFHSDELIEVVANGESRGNGSMTQYDWQSGSQDPQVLPDSEPLVLWRSSNYPSGAKSTYDPPFDAGVAASRLILRFVKE